MKHIWVLVLIPLCVGVKEDVDGVDDDDAPDSEAQLKCDACQVVAYKFGEAFVELKNEMKDGETPPDEDIVSVAESVCDDMWTGYGVTMVEGEERLSGPGTDYKMPAKGDDGDDGNLWSHRLQDMCDEFLGEVTDEKILYHTWASGNSLEEFLCRGEGTFAACVVDDWGPWPGGDYDDYEDVADFDYVHDEF